MNCQEQRMETKSGNAFRMNRTEKGTVVLLPQTVFNVLRHLKRHQHGSLPSLMHTI